MRQGQTWDRTLRLGQAKGIPIQRFLNSTHLMLDFHHIVQLNVSLICIQVLSNAVSPSLENLIENKSKDFFKSSEFLGRVGGFGLSN